MGIFEVIKFPLLSFGLTYSKGIGNRIFSLELTTLQGIYFSTALTLIIIGIVQKSAAQIYEEQKLTI